MFGLSWETQRILWHVVFLPKQEALIQVESEGRIVRGVSERSFGVLRYQKSEKHRNSWVSSRSIINKHSSFMNYLTLVEINRRFPWWKLMRRLEILFCFFTTISGKSYNDYTISWWLFFFLNAVPLQDYTASCLHNCPPGSQDELGVGCQPWPSASSL